MAPAILSLHYCSVHHLLFCPALQVWLSCTPVQIEHTFGEAMRLTESTCPRCTTMTQEMLHKQFPKRYPYSEKPEVTPSGDQRVERQPTDGRTRGGETVHDESAQSNRREHSGATGKGVSLHSSDPSSSETPTGEPTGVQGQDHTRSEKPQRKKRAKHKEQWDRRLLSYVRKKAEGADESAEEGTTSEHNLAVEVVARQAVCAYEKARGRVADQMPQTHPGYDIISRNPITGEERFIEVKGRQWRMESDRCWSVEAPVQQCSGLW